MATKCEVSIQFTDGVTTIRDKDLISKFPLMVEAIEQNNPDWQTTDLILDALPVPFTKEPAEFIFKYIRGFQPFTEKMTAKDYPKAMKKSLEFLKEVAHLSEYLKCEEFHHIIAVVIGEKLKDIPMQEVANFIGCEYDPNVSLIDEN